MPAFRCAAAGDPRDAGETRNATSRLNAARDHAVTLYRKAIQRGESPQHSYRVLVDGNLCEVTPKLGRSDEWKEAIAARKASPAKS